MSSTSITLRQASGEKPVDEYPGVRDAHGSRCRPVRAAPRTRQGTVAGDREPGMIFSSTIFLFAFLPVVLLVHYAMPRKGRNLVLLLASLVFYFWGETFFVGVMLVSILANHAFGLLVDRAESRRAARRIVGLAVAVNLGLLVACKYTSFLTENLNVLLAALGLEAIERAGTDRLPLGISFFTFQALSYVIDVYRGQSRARRGPLNLALYISMFPQLIAGPIVRYHQIEEQLAKRRVTLEHLGRGVQRFVIGLGKKVLLARLEFGWWP